MVRKSALFRFRWQGTDPWIDSGGGFASKRGSQSGRRPGKRDSEFTGRTVDQSISPHVPHVESVASVRSRVMLFQPIMGPYLPHRSHVVCKRYSGQRDIAMAHRPCNKGVGDSKETSEHSNTICA